MANIKQIKLPNNTTYDLKDESGSLSSHWHHDEDLKPLISKTYASTSYYASANNWANATWYFMSIKPDSWYKPFRVKLKVHSFCPSYSTHESYTWCTLTGRQNSIAYINWNERNNSAHSYLTYYPLTQAGFNAGYGHAIGISIYNADNRTSSAYYRTFEVDYYECENCTVTILDTPVKWANWTGTGTTNYGTLGSFNAVDRGLQETGDANSQGQYLFCYNTSFFKSAVVAESLACGDINGYCQVVEGATFDITYPLLWVNAEVAANGTNYANTFLMHYDRNLANVKSGFNSSPRKIIYLVLSISGITATVDGQIITDTLPTTEDGKYYMKIGRMGNQSTGQNYFIFLPDHPIYHYSNGAIREFVQDAGSVNGHTVAKDVPANAVFTDNNDAVAQTPTNSTNADYRVLMSSTADDSQHTEGARKDSAFKYNPYYNKLYAGCIEAKESYSTLHSNSVFDAPDNTKIVANASALIQSPIPKYLWHDVFAFCRVNTPTYYVSADNTTWTEATLDKRHFAGLDRFKVTVIAATGQTGARWVWHHSGFQYCSAAWLVLGVAYTATSANVTILFESSADGETWTTRHISTHQASSNPIWCKVKSNSADAYLRLTLTKDVSDTTGAMNIGAIKLLTARWGDQGQGAEYEYPYNWDADGVITPMNTGSAPALGTLSIPWKNGYFTNINGVAVGSSPKFTDTTYESKQEAQGGTDLSLVTTGEKYTWNHTGVVNDGTLTIKQNNTSKGTFTANQSGDTEIELTDTTYESLPEASGGTDLSLITTGDKWNWNRTFPFKPGLEVASLDDLVGLMDYSTDKRCFSGVIKITTNIGIGVTGWRRIIAIAQNAVNNGTYDIGMFCMFFPANTSDFVNYALIDGKTTGNYSVSKTGQFVTNVFASTVQITTAGNGQLNLGNNLASGATGKSRGRLVIFSNTDTHYSDIRATGLSDNRNLFCPDKSGTIALEADLYKYLDIEKETTTGATVYPISSLALADGLTSGYVGGIRIQLMPATSILQLLGTNGTTVGAELSSGYLKLYGNNGGIDNATAQRLRLMASNESNYYVDLGTKESTPAWCFAPAVTKKLRLGSPSYLWTTVYAQSGSINTSDRNEKKDIVPLDESAKDFIMALNPVSYKFKDGESGRTHYGMIAQDVEQEMAELGMTAMDFAGFCKDQKTVPYTEEKDGRQIQKDMPVEGEYTYGLRYEEFMAPAIKTIQLLQNQVDTQQQEIDELKQQLAEIKAMLNGGN